MTTTDSPGDAAPADWLPEVEEIDERRRLALGLGGPERVQRQHDQGKFTIRERIEGVLDPGSFHEIGRLAGASRREDGRLVEVTPAPFIGGLGKIDGRTVAVAGEDFTIGGGSAIQAQERSKQVFHEQLALEYRVPLLLFFDGAGANVANTKEEGYSHLPSSFDVFGPLIDTGREVPVLGAIVGPTAGAPAARAMLCHFTVMPRGESASIFAAGPPVVKRAVGQELTKRELGGAEVHVYESGAVDNVAEDEQDAFAQMRKFLSYFPDNVDEQPPVHSTADPVSREEEELLRIIPRNRSRPYDMRKLVRLVVDDGDFFEVKPHFGTSVHTLLARVGGFPVGIVANNPAVRAGAMTAESADKQGHFVELCAHFRIPIVFIADVPGFMIGQQAERAGTLRHGMRAYWATYGLNVPVFTIITRKNYGMAGQATADVGGINYRVGWPSGEWGSMPVEGGVDAAYRREIANAPDPDKRRAEIEAELIAIRDPFRTAEAFGVEDIIDPRKTRAYIGQFLEIAYKKLSTQPGGVAKRGVRP
jgi:acetyl-CoA carboxylase carboxyltransferase component